MHEVAGSSPVESTKTPRFGIAVSGCFFVALFRQGERVGAALREQSVFAPLHFAYAFFRRKQTIDYRLAGRAATGASPVESTKTPRFGIAVPGCFLLRVAISFMPYKKRRTKSIRCLSYGVIFCFCTENGFYLTPPPPPPCPPPEKPPKCPPLPPPPRNVPPPLGFGRDIADTNDERSMELSST